MRGGAAPLCIAFFGLLFLLFQPFEIIFSYYSFFKRIEKQQQQQKKKKETNEQQKRKESEVLHVDLRDIYRTFREL